MIKRLYVDNYRSLVNFELPLQELTLLMGPNGVGKTSVLDVMFALRQLLAGVAKVTDAESSASTLTRWQTRPCKPSNWMWNWRGNVALPAGNRT